MLFLLLVILIFLGILLGRNLKSHPKKGNQKRQAVTEQEMQTEEKENGGEEKETPTELATESSLSFNLAKEDLYSANAILVRAKTGEVLLDKGSTEQIYPASMTKIMTAIVILEKIPDLQVSVRLSEEMFDELYRQEASMAGFLPGETVTARDLLYGVLLPSGAECCTGLADYVAGSEEAFAELMNQKAAELGMTGTHFVNASGLHDPDHYTTAADIEKLLEYALQNDTFREIASSCISQHGDDRSSSGRHYFLHTLFGSMTERFGTADLFRGEDRLHGGGGTLSCQFCRNKWRNIFTCYRRSAGKSRNRAVSYSGCVCGVSESCILREVRGVRTEKPRSF